MSAEDDVRKASEAFYAALNRMGNGEKNAMSDVWVQGPDITVLHPIGGRSQGWDMVRASFDKVAGMASDARITLTDQFIQVYGDLAYELGVEHGAFTLAGHPVQFEIRVTNIYRRVDTNWRVVHHHTDLAPAMLEVLSRL